MIHILHLSDIHLGTPSDALKYRTQLQTDLRLELGVKTLDYLVVSGDVANRSAPEEYDVAYTLFSKLMTRFKVAPNHVILAPGNHDLNWDLAKAAYDFVRAGDVSTSVPEHYRIPAGAMGALVRNDDRYQQRFAHFGAFYEKVTDVTYPLDFAEQGVLHLFPEDHLLFLNLNSAWEIDDHYRERAGINMLALSGALDRLLDGDYDDWLKFAVWHHPVTGREMMNDEFLEQLTVHGFHVCMHGHIHEAREGFYKYDEGRGIHIVGAGTFGAPTKSQTPGIPLQYNLLELDPQARVLTVKTRRKEKPDGAWMADARWGDRNNPRPWYEIQLGPKPDIPQSAITTPIVQSGQVTESDFADLEIHILPQQEGVYPVDLELNGQNVWRGRIIAEDLHQLTVGTTAAGGPRLFDMLFSDEALRTGWAEARALSPQRRTRLRLWLDVDEPELHTLPWELLQQGPLPLAADAKTPFSRYLPVEREWGAAVVERPLRALALIANPDDLATGYNLASLDEDAERALLEAAFGTVGSEEVVLDFVDPPVTLTRLEAKLREHRYHILHYVGQGAFSDREKQGVLYLQDGEGSTQITTDDALVGMLARQYDQPLLVFLAACQSGTTSERETFSGLGPKLVQIGIPAVVAMQDNVAVKTANAFSAAFYPQLLKHGLVDRAMNEARSTLLTGEYADAAAPVLLMRLEDGRLLKMLGV